MYNIGTWNLNHRVITIYSMYSMINMLLYIKYVPLTIGIDHVNGMYSRTDSRFLERRDVAFNWTTTKY